MRGLYLISTGFLLLPLGPIPLAGDGPVPDRPPPADLHRIALPDDPGQRHRDPLDWILRRLSSESDDWVGEQIHDEVSRRLHELEALLLDSARLKEDLKGFLTADFRGASLRGREVRAMQSSLASAWRRAPEEGGKEMGAEEFARDLERFLEPVSRVDKAKFKVYRVDPGPGAPRTARTDVLLELDGPAPSTGHAQLRADLRIHFREEEGSFRIARLEFRRGERTVLARRPFTDITAEALGGNASYQEQLRFGLEHWRTRIDAASEIEIYGHQGIAVGDVDGDGREDLYVAQPAGLPNRLFRAREDGTFVDITARAGVGILDETGAVLFFDAEGDGDPDLLVVTPLELLLFENDGSGRFRRRSGTGLEAAEVRRASMIGAAIADYDLDGDLDIYVISYVFWAGASSKLTSPYPFPYHDANNGAPNFLFRNEGSFRFTDVTEPSGMGVNNRRFSLAASWCDYDQDGDPDLYVANDFGKNNLYRNEGGGSFRDVAEELGVEDIGNGMSVAWEDYDGDGLEDLYVGNMWSSAGSRLSAHPGFRRGQGGAPELYARMAKGNTLFRNLGGGRFEDVTERAGVAFGRWAWSSQFFDADGDGHLDLYVLNGFVTGAAPDDL